MAIGVGDDRHKPKLITLAHYTTHYALITDYSNWHVIAGAVLLY